MIDFSEFSLLISLIIFGITAGVITYVGYYLSTYADQLADITGFGEAATGAILLGAVTSLSGIVTSVVAAIELDAALAVSNSLGGITAQTAFLAIADITYRKANLEHAAASIANIMYGMILILLLMELLFISVTPNVSIWGVHPGILIVPVSYIAGLKMVTDAESKQMWSPKETRKTVLDVPNEEFKQKSLTALLLKFIASAIIIAACGYIVAQVGIEIADKSGLSSNFVGALFTAVSTSLPELVVTITAVSQGALTLAVGNILGGNTFDILMVPIADVFYREGSILHHSGEGSQIVMVLAGFITTILTLGLIDREKEGLGNIGWESFILLLSFVAGYAILYFS